MVWYATREDVKTALDAAETARSNAQVDRALSAASDAVEGLCHRRFYPEIRSITRDFPDGQYARPWRLWLNHNELISLTSLVSGGVSIPAVALLLRPDWGPPFTHIEIDLSSQSAFASGSTHQRAITVTGLFGYRADEAPAGALAAAIVSTTATTANVTDSSVVGVGQIIRVDAERMIVTGKQMLTTGQTLQTPLAASVAAVAVAVTNGAAYTVGEVLLLDSERMLIVDAAGNQLTVKRAWDGTVLATHTGSTIYAPRTLTVVRGALGTTATTHSLAAAAVKHVVPGLVNELCVGEALNTLLQERTGYARPARLLPSQDPKVTPLYGVGLDALRDQVYAAYGRKARMRAI